MPVTAEEAVGTRAVGLGDRNWRDLGVFIFLQLI